MLMNIQFADCSLHPIFSHPYDPNFIVCDFVKYLSCLWKLRKVNLSQSLISNFDISVFYACGMT